MLSALPFSSRASTKLFTCFASSSTARRLSSSFSDVVVVGAGPTGLTLGALLSKMGIKATILEKRPHLTSHPQAHFINHRSMEIFRPLDGLAAEMQRACPPLHDWRKFVYCESLTGLVLGEVDHFQGQDEALSPEISPEPVMHFSQNRLLPMLLDRCAGQQVLFGEEATKLEYVDGGVKVICLSKAGSGETVVNWRSKYLIVADGANSLLRQQMGIGMHPAHAMQHLINVHFKSPDLAALLSSNPAMLYFVLSSNVIMVIVAHDLQTGSFAAQIPFFPPLQTAEEFDTVRCKQLIDLATGASHNVQDLIIKSIKPWTMRAGVADTFSQGGCVFLAGDAAHVFPPAGGFGMNTGVQDAHNLAWKLAAVLKGEARNSVLNTYSEERRPVARANAELSVRNWEEASKVPAILGLNPGYANMLSEVSANVVGSLFPKKVAKSFLEMGLKVGTSLSGVNGLTGPYRRLQLMKLFQTGNTLRLQFPNEDIGFQYRHRSLPEALAASDAHSTRAKRRILEYIAKVDVGLRLPHCYFQALGQKSICSSLDLLDPGGTFPILIVHHDSRWTAAALELLALGHAFKLVCVLESESSNSVSDYVPYVDAMNIGTVSKLEVIDCCGTWTKLAGCNAVFVRPDGHIWWVSSEQDDDSRTVIHHELSSMLC